MCKYFLPFFLIFSISINAQIITTIAGIGYGRSYSGDGKPAITAGLSAPTGVAVDSGGNLYIADQFNNRVRKIDKHGIITTIAGNSLSGGYNGDSILATSATLDAPSEVAVDNWGNVYIADFGNQRIRKVTPAGIITTVAGNGFGAPGPGGFSGDGGPAINAELFVPYGIAVDVHGNLFIADQGNNRVRKVDSFGIITTVAGNGYGAAWTGGFSGDGGPATDAELFEPGGVAVDSLGNLFIADVKNSRIRKVNTAGIITTIAGTGVSGYSGDGSMATLAELVSPTGVTFDKKGNLYITDANCNRVRKVNSSGIISTLAGVGTGLPYTDGFSGDGGPATLAKLGSPVNATSDKYGNIYIADANNNRIRYVIQFLPPISGIVSPCRATTDTFGNEFAGGVWSSSDTSIVSVDSNIGTVSDLNTGSTIISYNLWDIAVTFNVNVRSCEPEVINSIFPNPVTSELHLTSTNQISKISIFNVLGQHIFTNRYSSQQVEIDVSAVPAGVYFICINNSEVRKFVKL